MSLNDESNYYKDYLGKTGKITDSRLKTGDHGEYITVDFDDGMSLNPYIKNLELIEKNIIKKSDLKGGDIVTYRNNNKRIVDIKNKRIVYLDDFNNTSFDLDEFNVDLFRDNRRYDTEWDIVEVYRPATKETFITERKKETKKMTVAQICEELGYDIEIIKEDK